MTDRDWVSFGALGSTAVVGVVDVERLDAARAAVEEVVKAFDEACSRFREDSELERLNRAGGETVPVESAAARCHRRRAARRRADRRRC